MNQILFFIFIYFSGICLIRLINASAPTWFVHTTAFLMGLFNWVINGLICLMLLGRLMFLPVLLLISIEMLFCAAWLIKRRNFKVTFAKIGFFLIGIAVITTAGLFFEHYNIVNITPDSLRIIKMGIDFSNYGFSEFYWETPASFGVFIGMVQAASVFLNVDYLYLLQPIISISFIALFLLALVDVLGNTSIVDFLLPIAATGFIYSSALMQFQFSYIHTNIISMAFFFAALISVRFYLYENHQHWLLMALIMFLASCFTRTENVYISLIFIFILLANGDRERKISLIPIFLFIGVNIFWQIELLIILRKNPESMLSDLIVVSGIGFLLLFALIVKLLQAPKIKQWIANRFMWKFLSVCILAFTAALLFNPANIWTSIISNLKAILVTGGWDLTWPIILVLLFITCWKTEQLLVDEFSQVLWLGLSGFYIFILVINIFREPYHTGWGDSANRIFSAILPLIILLIFQLLKINRLKSATIDTDQNLTKDLDI